MANKIGDKIKPCGTPCLRLYGLDIVVFILMEKVLSCGVVWFGMVRCGAVWCGAVCCGAVCCGAVWCSAVRCVV